MNVTNSSPAINNTTNQNNGGNSSTNSTISILSTSSPNKNKKTAITSSSFHLITPRNKHSIWWRHYKIYDPLRHPDSKNIAVCSLCNEDKSVLNGTSVLARHLYSKHFSVYQELLAEEKEKVKKKSGQGGKISSITQLTFKKAQTLSDKENVERWIPTIANWIMDAWMPLSVVEQPSFRKMFEACHDHKKKDLISVSNFLQYPSLDACIHWLFYLIIIYF